jgi:glyoxylase-like metal-dependent hydrolase (beta-lactamase superfamily II)
MKRFAASQPLAALVAFLILVAMLWGSAAHAGAPMAKKSGPGYYRMMLGDFEVTAILDGTVALPVNQLLKIPPADTDAALARWALRSPLETSVNGFLVNTGDKLVLIDTGAAKLFGPTLGNLLDNIRASGYTPEQIDEVYVTHMHADHVGGLMNNGQRAFPNAVVRADKGDADFWLSKEQMDKAPDAMKGFFQGAQASVGPYVAAGKFSAFDGNTQLAPGIRSQVTRGHTPGHSVYVVESKGEKMVVLGDLMHVAAVQFANPAATIQFDTDSPTAAAQRSSIYQQAAAEKFIFAVAHVSFPGLGRVVSNGAGGFTWVPVNYSVVK